MTRAAPRHNFFDWMGGSLKTKVVVKAYLEHPRKDTGGENLIKCSGGFYARTQIRGVHAAGFWTS